MRRVFAISSLLCVLVAWPCGVRAAPDVAAFWAAFRSAVARDDRAAVAEMTTFPVRYVPRGGRQTMTDRAVFLAIYDTFFTGPVKRCLARTRTLGKTTRYSVVCTDRVLLFDPVGDRLSLTMMHYLD